MRRLFLMIFLTFSVVTRAVTPQDLEKAIQFPVEKYQLKNGLTVLLHPDARQELRTRHAEDPRPSHDLERTRRLARGHRLDPFVAHALGRHLAEGVERGAHRRLRRCVEGELQCRNEASRAENP